MKLAFVCAGDAFNVRTWSGTPFHMLHALKRHADVVEVVREPWAKWFTLTRKIVRKLSRGRFELYWSPFWSALGSRACVKRLLAADCDAVVTVAMTPVAARLTGKIPTVFISDATFAAMVDYNQGFKRLGNWTCRTADELEGRAIRGAALAAFPSEWAHQSALLHYGADPAKARHIHWGANLVASDRPLEPRADRPWRLLFVGVDWRGKGGDIVLETFRGLKERGLDVELDIVGSAPSDPPPAIHGVTFHGFVRKDTPDGRAAIERLFRRSHMLILPTQFEALGIVHAEAASFAMPAISYRTGGVAGNIIDGETGMLLSEGAPAAAFVSAIAELIDDPTQYKAMSEAAYRFSREHLNWDAWARAIVAQLSG